MSYTFLETEHFTVRQWAPEDAIALWKIMSDSRVQQYTGDTPGPWNERMNISILCWIKISEVWKHFTELAF